PTATFLFVGPTGVGKTETTKALAEFLFGSIHRLIRFDMSEFQRPDAVGRLIGDRFRPDGELTRRVQQQPFSVVLLDEVEKAHPAVFDSLLQVLGEGRLTNAAGRTVSFTNTIIVMTSNLGVREADKRLGFEEATVESLNTHYRRAAERFFRPEFFNRIDRTVAFRPLDREVIVPLVARLLARMLSRQGLKRSSILVDVDPALVEILVEQGFDRRYGARSIKRLLEQRLAVPLAHHLVNAPSADLRWVEVYPQGDSMGMAVQALMPQTKPAIRGAAPVKSWKQIEARHAGLRLALDAIVDSEARQQHQAEHARLLEGLNQQTLTEAGESRLQALGSVQEQLRQLGDALDAFEERFLQVENFELKHVLLPGPGRDDNGRPLGAENVRIQRLDRGPLPDATVQELERLELITGRIDHQRKMLDAEADDRLLIRFECDQSSTLLNTLRRWIGAWGTIEDRALIDNDTPAHTHHDTPWGFLVRVYYARGDEWSEASDTAWCRDESSELRAAALLIRGRGVASLIEPELGIWAWRYETGPDYRLDIVRIEDVGHHGDPLERLAALDASNEAMRAARREGKLDGPLRTELPLIRWFDNDGHKCSQTGVEYEPKNEVFLQRVVLRRLHAAMMNRILNQGGLS
ncbi:MAG: AAA family ATPase, partial [Myxococcota bacterium]